MKIRITSTDSEKWFVRYYGTGGLVNVKGLKVGDFYELTDSEFRAITEKVTFINLGVTKLFIPAHSAEVDDAVS